MQITLKDRETLTGVVTIYTQPVDLSSMPMFTFNMTAHALSGTGPSIDLSFETSDNLEDWVGLTSPTGSLAAVGSDIGTAWARNDSYGRYVRAKIVTAGTTPMVNYSLWLNTFAGS